MPPSIPSVKTNAFNMSQQLLGQLALAINSTRVISGTLGGAAALQVGSRVLLDSAVVTPGVVRFLPCPDATPAFGVIIYSVQEDLIQPGDTLEVAFCGFQCIVEFGSTTLIPGTEVGLAAGFLVQSGGANAPMGLLIDYVQQSTAGRVIIGWQPC